MRELYKDRRWNALVGAINAGLAVGAVVVVLARTLGPTSGDRLPTWVLAVPFRRREALLADLPHLEDIVGSERRTRDRTGRLLSINVVRDEGPTEVGWSVRVMRPRIPVSRPRLIASGLDNASAAALRDETRDRIHGARLWRPPTSAGHG